MRFSVYTNLQLKWLIFYHGKTYLSRVHELKTL